MLKMKNLQSKASVFAALIVMLILGGPVPAGSQTQMQFASGWMVNNNADWTPFPPSTNPLGPVDNNCTGASTPTGSWAEFTFSGFTLPVTDIVLGIEVRVNYLSASGSNTVQLTKSGTLVGSTRTVASVSGQSFCSNTAWVTAGTPTDLWGTTLTVADFNSGSVGFRLTQNANTVDVDAVELIVYHASGTNNPPDCSGAAIADQSANASCQATISGSDVTGVTDPDGDVLTITVNPTTLNLGANTVTVSADDGNGGMCSKAITVNVVDKTAPVPDAATLPDATGECSVTLTPPTATDNCAGSITATTTDPVTYTTQGTFSVTWTYNDGNGNTSQQTQNVIVDDVTDPVITCPTDITVDNDPGQGGAVVNFTVTATDNCDVSVVCTPASGSTFPIGTTTVNCTATDAGGNQASCSFDVTVVLNLVGELKVKNGVGESLHLETFNTDPNLSVIWNTLFGVAPPTSSGGIITLQADQVVTWEEGALEMGGVMKLDVKTDPNVPGVKKVKIKKAGKKDGTTTFVSGSGGVNPNLADGGWHEVKVKNMLDVTVSFDGETVTGLLKELKVKLDKNSTTAAPEVTDFKIDITGVTTAADVKKGTVNSVMVTIPETRVTALATTEYDEELKDKPKVLDGHTEAEFKRAKNAVTEGVDIASLSDGFNDQLKERKGPCSISAAPASLPKLAVPTDDVTVQATIPEGYALEQNYPNPFNPSTTITFAVPEASEVTLSIYNLLGQVIRTLHSGPIAAGRHSMVWNGTDSRGAKVASGIYVYTLRAKDFVATRKLVFTK